MITQLIQMKVYHNAVSRKLALTLLINVHSQQIYCLFNAMLFINIPIYTHLHAIKYLLTLTIWHSKESRH